MCHSCVCVCVFFFSKVCVIFKITAAEFVVGLFVVRVASPEDLVLSTEYQ